MGFFQLTKTELLGSHFVKAQSVNEITRRHLFRTCRNAIMARKSLIINADTATEPPLGMIREQKNSSWDPWEQGAWPKIRKGAESKENVVWEQGAQKM